MLKRPYRRIIRPFPVDASSVPNELFRYEPGGPTGSYLKDPDYAQDRIEAVRSYYTLERDLVHLFDYVEPTDSNLPAFSIRMYELLLRACTEVEANCKAILAANKYQITNDWRMSDYRRINQSSRLSDYEVRIIVWRQPPRVIRPFVDWANKKSPSWYCAYNAVKHDRHREFEQANLENTIGAIAALRAILFSQFYVYAFRARDSIGIYTHDDDQWLSHEDSVFAVRPPQTWADDERYDFDWSQLQGLPDRFEQYQF